MGAELFLRRGRPRLAVAVALVLLAAACDFEVGTDPGQLDPDFGDEGVAMLDGIRVRTDDSMTSAARLPDGRVVAVGSAAWLEPWALTRFRRDGSLDRSFGGDGVVSVGLEPMGDIAVAPDGAILVPGRTQNSQGEHVWGVARFLPNGEPDPGFGVDGVAALDVAGASGQNWTVGVVGDGDRTYLLAWSLQADSTRDTIVLALGPDGALDPSFGPDGTGVLHITNAGWTGAIDVAPDGAIVVSYASDDWSQPTIAGVVRISPAGEILTRLDLATAGTPTPLRSVTDMDLAADGSVALTASDQYGEPTSYALRVTPALALDTSFGNGGAVSLGPSNLASEVLVDDTTGRVVVAEERRAIGDVVTVGLAADGSPDPGWGDGGIAVHATWTTPTTAVGLFATRHGVLIAGRTSQSPSDPGDFYQLALTPTGEADPGFGDDGWARADIGNEASEDFTAVAALPEGDLLVAGDTGNRAVFADTSDGVVAGRYDADGTADADHPPEPLLPERLRGPHHVADLAVAEDGSSFLLVQRGSVGSDWQYGGGSFTWVVVKLDADGAVDPAFGDDGVAAAGGSTSLPLAIAVRADGTVLVAVIDVTPARVIPPRQYVPASFTDRMVALTPAGAPTGTTTTFGTTTNPPPPTATDALVVGPAGDAYVVANRQVQRVAPDGTVSAGGPLPSGATLAPTDLAVDGEGRVLVYGSGNVPGGAAGDVVARFDAALGLDPTFGTAGLTALPAPDQPGDVYARDMHVHADGALTVVHQGSAPGHSEPDLLVHRLLPSGQPDASFSGDGRAEGALNLDDSAAWASASTVAGSDVILTGRIPTGAFATRVNG